MLSPRLGTQGSLERFSSNDAPKPVLNIPGHEMPGKLSESLKVRWARAEKQYEDVVARGKK